MQHTRACCRHTVTRQKPQEDDSFELDDIDNDIETVICLTLMFEFDV